MCGHLGNLAVLDGHVHQPIDMVLVIEHMSAAKQQIVGGCGLLGECANAGGQRERNHGPEHQLRYKQ